jgi:hypothetical protein
MGLLFRFTANMKLSCTFALCTILLFSCQSGNQDSTTTDTTTHNALQGKDGALLPEIQNNPVALKKLDSIPVPALKDTTGRDETGKDSIKFARLFQLAANRLCRAEQEKNYIELASFTPDAIIRFYKSRQAYIKRMKMNDEDRPQYDKILAGPIQKIAPATDDQGFASAWYCLIPVRSYRKNVQGDDMVDVSWIGGQCDIQNQKVYFLNVTGLSREQIVQVMPDLTYVLDKK